MEMNNEQTNVEFEIPETSDRLEKFDKRVAAARTVFQLAISTGAYSVATSVIKSFEFSAPHIDKWYGKLMWNIGRISASWIIQDFIVNRCLEAFDAYFEGVRSAIETMDAQKDSIETIEQFLKSNED